MDKQNMRIGVTGHRWNKLSRAASGALEAKLRETLNKIDAEGHTKVTLVSGLAEGTDTLAALVRPPRWRLEAALALAPVPWRDRLADSKIGGADDVRLFDRAVAQADVVVMPHRSTPDFTALATYLVATCNVIIAVWDGIDGPPGGTSDVVRRALNADRRVIVIPVRDGIVEDRATPFK